MREVLISILEKLNLTEKERVFLSVACELANPTMNDIIKKSGLKKPTAYKILESLTDKRLLQRSAPSYNAALVTPTLEQLLEYAKRRTRQAKKVEPISKMVK